MIYIVHLSVFDAVDLLGIHDKFGDILYILISLALVVIVSIILHLIVEKPAVKLERIIINKICVHK